MPTCITCLLPLPHLYTIHNKAALPSGDNVRLTRCGRCGNVGDKYVEHDYVVLFIDMVLMKLGAYRHVYLNVLEKTKEEEEEGKYHARKDGDEKARGIDEESTKG